MDVRGHARVMRDVPSLVCIMEDEAGVDRAAARSAREPVERRQPHGRVDGFSVFDSARRGAGPEVQDDQVEVLRRLLHESRHGAENK